ncbi:hypothetical protein BS50DRAFT_316128 [Corynespora cassiicola Philippines]|uniref:Uncharacterized protein n=1 Tax=Corynespora cassiicola Philippines TaxID=1448308 RepID=A0A2T2NYN8_CORCC|nr:hypothetical protein BS50DRAFT_316128 [Corynespora cassiicola Philippines]
MTMEGPADIKTAGEEVGNEIKEERAGSKDETEAPKLRSGHTGIHRLIEVIVGWGFYIAYVTALFRVFHIYRCKAIVRGIPMPEEYSHLDIFVKSLFYATVTHILSKYGPYDVYAHLGFKSVRPPARSLGPPKEQGKP